MLSSECWLGRHDYCSWPENCDCLCHVTADQLMKDIGDQE